MSTGAATNESVPTTVRLDPSLRRQLEDAAKASFRSLSGEMVFRLTESLKPTAAEAAS